MNAHASTSNREIAMASIPSNISANNIDCAIRKSIESMGYSTLKEKQKEVIVNILRGNDVFAVLPTGYGKSL